MGMQRIRDWGLVRLCHLWVILDKLTTLFGTQSPRL